MQYLTLFILLTISFWFISYNARYGSSKSLFIIVGLYLIFTSPYDSFYTAMGLGLILPHLRFLYSSIKLQIFIIKQVGNNGYYLLLSIYFKIINFFKWLKSLFEALKIYLQTMNYSKAQANYEKENPKEEKFDYSKYEEKKQEFKQATSEDIDDYIDDEYKQFYSSDPYVILAVNKDDNLQTIKKAYRNLVQIHHPDKNTDRYEEATAITQQINDAYDKLKKIHS